MERKVPLQRTPMKRGSVDSQLARSPMKRARTRIRAVSQTKKRRREQKEGPSMADLRPILWERCGGRCERCNRALDFETFDAHHRKFRSRGGKDEIANLVALCHEHHRWAHMVASEALPAGFSVLMTENPLFVPLHIPFGMPVYLTEDGTYTRKTPLEGEQ